MSGGGSLSSRIAGFQGDVVWRDNNPGNEASHYNLLRYQYASSSHSAISDYGRMAPSAILYPANQTDVVTAVNYVRDHGVSASVRTGGYQASGASSTSGGNVQIDMSELGVFQEFECFDVNGKEVRYATAVNAHSKKGETPIKTVRVGVNYALKDVNKKLGDVGLFVPHGQAGHVHLGGHVQTGGYGQLARAFGLLGDHVVGFEIVTAESAKKAAATGDSLGDGVLKVTKASHPDLFYAVLGGSPGNFGVVTHVTLEPLHDKDHPESRGLRLVLAYSKELLAQLAQRVVDVEALPADFDLSVTLVSSVAKLPSYFGDEWDSKLRAKFAEQFGGSRGAGAQQQQPAVILVYAQWSNVQGTPVTEQAKEWFAGIHELAKGHEFSPLSGFFSDGVKDSVHLPMSKLTAAWIYGSAREFDTPYVKRTYLSDFNKDQLQQNEWPAWLAERVDQIQGQDQDQGQAHGRHLSVLLQNIGGAQSAYVRNGAKGATSYSWRDSSVIAVLDYFYASPVHKAAALAWQAANDTEAIDHKKFSGTDRRLFDASYFRPGETFLDLNACWDVYYDSQEKYAKLIRVKTAVDPANIFTPNLFSLVANDYPLKHQANVYGLTAYIASLKAFLAHKILGDADPIFAISDEIDERGHTVWDDKSLLSKTGKPLALPDEAPVSRSPRKQKTAGNKPGSRAASPIRSAAFSPN